MVLNKYKKLSFLSGAAAGVCVDTVGRWGWKINLSPLFLFPVVQ